MTGTGSPRAVISWLLAGCFLVYLMVVIGCITRLTHSGLSITDWRMMEMLPPLSEKSWMEHFSGYRQSPEFQQVNFNMSLEEFKSIFWWEWIHRFVGRVLLGGTFFAGFVYFLIRKKFTRKTLLQAIFLCALGGAQGLIGWWMVKSGLVKDPAVSHYRLAIHLMSAFLVFAFTFWFALQLMNEKTGPSGAEQLKLRPLVIFLLIVLVAQIVFGAFVAGLKAGLLYPNWPKMGDAWFPSESILISDSFIHNFFANGAGVQWVHRTFAFLVVAAVAALWIRSNKLHVDRAVYRGVTLLIYGTAIQFVLGVFTLLYHVPVLMGVLHQTGAFFLFASCVYLLFHVTRRPVPAAKKNESGPAEVNPLIHPNEPAAAV